MATIKIFTATIMVASMTTLVQADTGPRMDNTLDSADEIGRLYDELETEWVNDKETNCARDAGVVEHILGQRDRGSSIGELIMVNHGEEKYYIRIAAHHWNDEGTARDTARNLYHYCVENGTYWSPLGPVDRRKG